MDKEAKEAIIKGIKAASVKVKICVPDSDFYAKRTDFSIDEIEIISPALLIEMIEKM